MNLARLIVTALLIGHPLVPVLADVDHRLSLSVVQIHAYPRGGPLFFGSGVAIGGEKVATNCHVTRRASEIYVAKGPSRHVVTAQQADIHHDLCLLTVPGLSAPEVTLGRTDQLTVGESIYFYGFPRALGMSFSAGRVEALHPLDGALVIETTTDFVHGASGGGVFDDRGQLIGLATFLAAGRTGHNFAIPADWIGGLSRTEAYPVAPLSGLSFWEDLGQLPGFLKPPASVATALSPRSGQR